jgi:hypothetical protein
MTMVLNPVILAHPSMLGTIHFFSPTIAGRSTLPLNTLPMMLS